VNQGPLYCTGSGQKFLLTISSQVYPLDFAEKLELAKEIELCRLANAPLIR